MAALADLYIHFVTAMAVAVVMALLAVTADVLARRASASGETAGFLTRLRFDVIDYALYCGAFALFGLVTAYFLALGLNTGNEDEVNTLVETFATPLISLLTAGVAFVAAKSRSQINSNELVLGVLSFLIACVVSYHTHTKQRFEIKGVAPAEIAAPTATTPEVRLPPPPAGDEPQERPTLAPPPVER